MIREIIDTLFAAQGFVCSLS